MEIQFKPELNPVPASASSQAAKARPAGNSDVEVNFDGAHALEEALSTAPDIRADKVEEGKMLVGSSQYPPIETMEKIARLLAVNL